MFASWEPYFTWLTDHTDGGYAFKFENDEYDVRRRRDSAGAKAGLTFLVDLIETNA